MRKILPGGMPGALTLRSMGAALAGLRADQRGNVLMIMGFALIPITFATGMVIDYSRAGRLQTKLNAAADAAALSANTNPMLSQPLQAACNAARRTFLNSLQQYSSGLVFNATTNLTIAVTESYASGASAGLTCPTIDAVVPANATLPLSRTVTVTYSGNSTNAFGGILGSGTIQIGGTATAKVATAPFIDIHMALDTSQSMGLAATDTDALNLWNATKVMNGPNSGCTFGCHAYSSSDSGYNAAKTSNEALAKQKGISLRIDELRDSTTDMIQSAIDNQGTNTYYRFGLYRVGATHGTISALSTDLATTKSTAQNITLGPNNASGYGDTNLPDTMTQMLSTITTHGDGTTRAQARAFFFIVTDGVTDVAGSCTYGHCTKPIDPATCKAFKEANITLGIVYTTYLPVKSDPTNSSSTALRPEYANLIKQFSWSGYTSPNPSDNSLDIAPALQACASSGWYFEATDAAGIHTAMQKLFKQASQTPTITQ